MRPTSCAFIWKTARSRRSFPRSTINIPSPRSTAPKFRLRCPAKTSRTICCRWPNSACAACSRTPPASSKAALQAAHLRSRQLQLRPDQGALLRDRVPSPLRAADRLSGAGDGGHPARPFGAQGRQEYGIRSHHSAGLRVLLLLADRGAMARQGKMSPWFGVWMGNIFFFLSGVISVVARRSHAHRDRQSRRLLEDAAAEAAHRCARGARAGARWRPRSRAARSTAAASARASRSSSTT